MITIFAILLFPIFVLQKFALKYNGEQKKSSLGYCLCCNNIAILVRPEGRVYGPNLKGGKNIFFFNIIRTYPSSSQQAAPLRTNGLIMFFSKNV